MHCLTLTHLEVVKRESLMPFKSTHEIVQAARMTAKSMGVYLIYMGPSLLPCCFKKEKRKKHIGWLIKYLI